MPWKEAGMTGGWDYRPIRSVCCTLGTDRGLALAQRFTNWPRPSFSWVVNGRRNCLLCKQLPTDRCDSSIDAVLSDTRLGNDDRNGVASASTRLAKSYQPSNVSLRRLDRNR